MGMMINRRRVCGGKSLPYDAEIEYLEGTGTQWIDTGLYFDTRKNSFEIDSTLINDISDIVTIAGNWETSWNSSYLACGVNGNYQNAFYSSPPVNFRAGTSVTALGQAGVRCKIKFINGGLNSSNQIPITRYVNDVLYDSYIMTNPYIGTTRYTIPIFGCRNGGERVLEISHLKLYNFKMYELNKVIMDLIPVRVGQTGYMYDKVSKQLFGNAGTGDFILGPDV